MSRAAGRISRFVKNVVAALAHCALEELELAGLTLLILGCIGYLLLFAAGVQVVYELIFDPNSVDVAARLASLSIEPSKWV